MKYLGIDYGSKRVGLAVSDEAGDFVFPFMVIKNTENIVQEISKICEQKNIAEIVVGESKNYNMEDNHIMKRIDLFVREISEKIKLKVHIHPEFLTSLEAERLQGKNDMIDASAAAIILKSYLETIKNNQKNGKQQTNHLD